MLIDSDVPTSKPKPCNPVRTCETKSTRLVLPPKASSLSQANTAAAREAGEALFQKSTSAGLFTQVAPVLGKIAGGVSVVSGGLQTVHGFQEMDQGRVVEGAADVVGGGAGMAAGVSLVAGVAGSAVPILGGVSMVADGIKDTYVGVRDSNQEKATVGAVKTLGGGLMIAGAATLDPVMAAAGAILYSGAVVYDNREEIARVVEQAVTTMQTEIQKAGPAPDWQLIF